MTWTSPMNIKLWEACGPFLILPARSGVVYENQIGYDNSSAVCEGHLVPFPFANAALFEAELEAVFYRNQDPSQPEKNRKLAKVSALLLDHRLSSVFSIDQTKADCCDWRWLHLSIRKASLPDHFLIDDSIFTYSSAILTWSGNIANELRRRYAIDAI